MDIKTNGPRVHVEKLREELKKEPATVSDELLRQHIRKLRIAWNPQALVTEKVA